ncbi:glycosyltransferase involved in cell wall biosynthesis [Pseudoxanthomonas taiwanensis J19]|uniref:Glycosyltransferase involved in cell wall biosynthesis n=1 Tax=Pseudoxanthomonas taiwanensis J19 TaxID=935569 RepID=A0A562DI29_9GAMM|nr:glycosyltransferase involved in cell wall biosynthesis [Pseudoxanthomonas taiwanensis J19]
MKLFVVRDSNFTLREGKPASNLLHYDAYAKRYLQVFDGVTLVGRLFPREDLSALPVTGENVDFSAFPAYQGPKEFVRCLPGIVRSMRRGLDRSAAYILRIPATIPSIYALCLWIRRIPFAVEVCADPYDGYSGRSLSGNRLAWFWQWLFVTLTRWQCKRASVTAYVTSHALQRRYPPSPSRPTFSFTSLDLDDAAFVPSPRQVRPVGDRLVMIGNMQKSLKGHDVLLQAMALLHHRGHKVRATLIGFGESLPKFQKMAHELGLSDYVIFTGKLASGSPIHRILDEADIFVLPSRQEGLPRALLEAMARGLPAIASDVGGTSELLEPHALVSPDNPVQLADRLEQFMLDPELRQLEASKNLQIARRYHIDLVNQSRVAFFRAVREATEQRLQKG